MTRIDRRSSALVRLEYTIPFADTCRTAGELPDSRTHQFAALCRSEPPTVVLPHWLSRADVDAARGHDLLPTEPTEADVLADDPAWTTCWTRIVEDADRRPIDCASALEGVEWDTAALTAGPWIVAGYTFDPPLNLWVPRRGVFRVVDDPEADPPAAAIAPHSTLAGSSSGLALRLCVDAPAGSTTTLEWSDATAESWTELGTPELALDGETPLALQVPDALAGGGTMLLRISVRAPDGSSFTYHSSDAITVVPGDLEPPGDSEPFDYCRDDPDALEPQRCGPTAPEPTPEGCRGCAVGSGADAGWLALPLLLIRPRAPRSGGCGCRRRRGCRRCRA